MTAGEAVATIDTIGRKDFYREYREFVHKRRPVGVRKLTAHWRALDWSLDRLRANGSAATLEVKLGDMGPTGSVTPLHFDTLLTNNLFFRLAGRKRFVLIPADQRRLCDLRDWRWAGFDPTDPDYEAFPLAKRATPVTVVLEPGDILYLPPGTLHHVTNLSLTMSFNLDWHTTRSAGRGVASLLQGAPWKNGWYNLVSLLGLGLGVPAKYLYPLYRSYLTYVS